MSESVRFNQWIILVLLAVLLAACSGPQLVVKPIATTENPSEQINGLDAELSAARNRELHVLAPAWFNKAETSLFTARQALENGAGVADILEIISVGRAQLQRSEEVAQIARTALSDVIQARKLAREANASQLGAEYGAAEEQFLALTQAVENDEMEWARRNQAKVSGRFRDLELKAIKTQTLGQVHQLMADAEQTRLQGFAPRTFALAQQALQEADAFISENPYEKDTMRPMAQMALFQAQRLQHIANQSQTLMGQQPEDIVLWVEDILTSMTTELGAPNMRNHAFETQVDNIKKSIAATQADLRYLGDQEALRESEMTALRQQIADLEGQTRQERTAKERLAQEGQVAQARMEAEHRFQRAFDEVAGQFDASEAEVYKQGNRLVIRLQAMQFPVGQDVIMPAHYALLGKVQRAIRRFNGPEVVIEGHTDSTGAEATNQHLSERRAESVREYLVANGILTQDKIAAVGYGAARPLASNRSVEGRAKNRRIDVIITPNGNSES